jgi:hypothetical protein
MGRATIISELGDGQYRIQPVIDTATAAAQISALTDENTSIDTRLAELVIEIAATELDLNFATEALHAAIINGTDATEQQKVVNDLQITLRNQIGSREYLRLKKVSNEKRIAFLTEQSATPDEIDAWCADLTEGATGTVGTIEVGRLNGQPIIKPEAPAHSDTTDGREQPVNLSTPAAAFYNYALITGAAKWRPRFRTGIASNIDTDANTMDITLDPLQINGVSCDQEAILTAVPVEYMTCNAEAFTDGDNVVVEFAGQEWSAAKVIGFVDHPQSCINQFWLRLTIDGYDLVHGGQQIAIEYTNKTGATVATSYKPVGVVGMDNGTVTVPAENYSLAGPFELENWNGAPATIVLGEVRDLLNSDVETVATVNGKIATNLDTMHKVYQEDPSGSHLEIFLQKVFYQYGGGDLRTICPDATMDSKEILYRRALVGCFMSDDVSYPDAGEASEWIWTSSIIPGLYGDFWQRYVSGSTHYSRVRDLPLGTISAGEIISAAEQPLYTATDITTGIEYELPLIVKAGSPGLVLPHFDAAYIDGKFSIPKHFNPWLYQFTNEDLISSGGDPPDNIAIGGDVVANSANNTLEVGTGSASIVPSLPNGWYTNMIQSRSAISGDMLRINIVVDSISGTKVVDCYQPEIFVTAQPITLVEGDNEFLVLLRRDENGLPCWLEFTGSGTLVISKISARQADLDYYDASPEYNWQLGYDQIMDDAGEPLLSEADSLYLDGATDGYLNNGNENYGSGDVESSLEFYVSLMRNDYLHLLEKRVLSTDLNYSEFPFFGWRPLVIDGAIVPNNTSITQTYTGAAACRVYLEYQGGICVNTTYSTVPAVVESYTTSINAIPLPEDFY